MTDLAGPTPIQAVTANLQSAGKIQWHCLTALLPILALACGQKSLDLQAAPHITASTDPTVVGTIDEQVGPIAVDAERLYWMGSQGPLLSFGNAALRSCKKQDCSQSLVTYDSGQAEREASFVVQNGQIYWFHYVEGSGRWSILGCDVSGCASGPRTVVANVESSFEMAVTSDAVYHDSYDGASYRLYRVALSGNAAPVEVATADRGVSGLCAHGEYLYWADGVPTTDPQPYTLRRARMSGNAPAETLAKNVQIAPFPPNSGYANLTDGLALAFDASYIYWSQGTLDGAIVRCPLAGCVGTPELVVAKVRWPFALLFDGSKLYWLHDSGSQGFAASSCTIGDCASPALLASGLNVSNALAIDDQYLYTTKTAQVLYPDVAVSNPVAQIRRFPK